jgi:hypothetical protein
MEAAGLALRMPFLTVWLPLQSAPLRRQLATWVAQTSRFLAMSAREFAHMASHAMCAPPRVRNMSRHFLPSL